MGVWSPKTQMWGFLKTPTSLLLVGVRKRVLRNTGVRAGGARGAAAPPNFGQLRFFGQQEKIWAKPGFKDVSLFFLLF